jgi:hypothetical protein
VGALAELQRLKKELWEIILYSKSGYHEKIVVVKEVTLLGKAKICVTKRLFIYYKNFTILL